MTISPETWWNIAKLNMWRQVNPSCLSLNSSSQCPSSPSLKITVLSPQNFGYFYGHASAVSWGRWGLLLAHDQYDSPHTTTYLGSWREWRAVHFFSFEALKGEVIPLWETISWDYKVQDGKSSFGMRGFWGTCYHIRCPKHHAWSCSQCLVFEQGSWFPGLPWQSNVNCDSHNF